MSILVPTAPPRSPAQRLEALDRANDVRIARAALKKDLKAGRVKINTLLGDPPACLDSMKVFDLLLAVPSLGRVKVDKALRRGRVSPTKTVGGLSERQRDELLRLVSR